MWMLQDLANNLPENWIVYQCIATADGTTALTYARDNSMRALMLVRSPAVNSSSSTAGPPTTTPPVRSCISWCVRHPASVTSPYEFKDGSSAAYDDIPDPLPFDINAPVIDIPDDDYGIWYMDCQDEPQKYAGKTVEFLAQVARPAVPARTMVLFRAGSP